MFEWITNRKTKYGILIDIGSGSVSAAITTSNASNTKPDLIWSTQQKISVHEQYNHTDVLEKIIRALKNVFETSGNSGIRALKTYDRHGHISYMQIGVSAPWSYTITKKVVLMHDEEFELTESVLEQAEEEAERKATKELDSLLETHDQNLSMAHSMTIATETKGYAVAVPFGVRMDKITLSRLFCYVDTRLMNVIDEYSERVFPDIEYSVHSFISLFYFAVRNLPINASELCIADVTSEAVEIGIIRNNILQHTTHMQSGVRIMASAPVQRKLTSEQACALCESQIGHELQLDTAIATVPKTLLFHTNARTESYFKERLTAALRQVRGEGVTHLAAPKLFDADSGEISALLVSAFVFQNKIFTK